MQSDKAGASTAKLEQRVRERERDRERKWRVTLRENGSPAKLDCHEGIGWFRPSLIQLGSTPSCLSPVLTFMMTLYLLLTLSDYPRHHTACRTPVLRFAVEFPESRNQDGSRVVSFTLLKTFPN